MIQKFKEKLGELLLALFGGVFTWKVKDYDAFIALFVGVITLIFVSSRAIVWILKARMAWRNRNNATFFQRMKDDE